MNQHYYDFYVPFTKNILVLTILYLNIKKKFGNTLEMDPSHSNAAHEYNGSVVCSTEYNTIWLENSPLVKMKWVWLIIMPDSSIGFIL